MIRALWFYVVLVISTVYHAAAAIVAGLLGMRHRSGGVYDWAGTDWARQILRAAGTPVQAEGLELIPRDRPRHLRRQRRRRLLDRQRHRQRRRSRPVLHRRRENLVDQPL